MTTTAAPATVESALLALASADGDPRRGFTGTDLAFGHALAGRVQIGLPVSDRHRRAAWRMLARYADTLRTHHGIDHAQIPEPPAPAVDLVRDAPPGDIRPECSVEVLGGVLFVTSPRDMGDALRQIPGSTWHHPGRCRRCGAKTVTCPAQGRYGWTYPGTGTAAVNLHHLLSQRTYGADEGFAQLLAVGRTAREAGQHRTAESLPPVPGLKTTAWLHQRQAFWFGTAQNAVLYWMEMGTGKSLVAVALIVSRFTAHRDPKRFRALILCPEAVVGVWPKQFRIHSAVDFHILDGRVQKRTGEWKFAPIKDRVREWDEALNDCTCGRGHIVVANYASTAHEPMASWGPEQEWDAFVVDEIHKIKADGGVWSKWAAKVGKRALFRAGLTGTLMPHSPLDVFGPVRALDPSVFGNSAVKFKREFAEFGGYGGHEIVGYKNQEELTRRISVMTYQVGAEVLDLPPAVPDVTYPCTLSPKAMKVYREVETAQYAEIVAQAESADADAIEDAISASNVLTKMLRLQQITGGAVSLDSGVTLEIDTAKADMLEEILSNIDPQYPVVVFTRFHHDLDAVKRVTLKMGRNYAELSGRRKDAITRDSTLADGVQVAGVQIQAGSTGIDFTASHYAVYYSLGYSLGDYLQSRKRLDRPGQENSVRFLHIVAEGTIDEEVYAALAAREEVAARLGRMIRDRIEGRGVPKPNAAGLSAALKAVGAPWQATVAVGS